VLPTLTAIISSLRTKQKNYEKTKGMLFLVYFADYDISAHELGGADRTPKL
jgi:hypothetical protein